MQGTVVGIRGNPQVMVQHQQQPGQMVKQVQMAGQQMVPNSPQMQGNSNHSPVGTNNSSITSPQFVHSVSLIFYPC